MDNHKKILLVVLPLIAVVILSLILVVEPRFNTTELTVEEKALSIITDVIGIDLSRYSVELYNNNSELWGSLFREHIDYTLESNESKMRVMITFGNGTLIHWDLAKIDSLPLSPIYVEPLPDNTLDVVKDALQRYQAYSEDSVVEEARNVLNTVTELKTMNKTVGDLKIRITVRDGSINIDWVRTKNGLDFATGLSINLANGVIDGFTDESRFFKIGSTDVNISREEAISIAREEAKTYTSVTLWGIGTFRFRVKEEPSTVRLQVGTANFTSYPYWDVWFAADPEVYSVTGVKVIMRADTGEITYSSTTQGF
ncbi:hypothetical protein JW988_00030 [Candidatus Bathyarchaeota archaeon]|nr:hypothetical protein [Candidatus Bathyarchaeota archaeon]